jgi:hypothetical protein
MPTPRAVASLAPAATALVLALVVGACVPGWLDMPVLTPDGGDTYDVTGTASELTVAAAAPNTGGNLRVALVPKDQPAGKDQEACATWTSATSDGVQQGIVLRWNGESAITVTKNVTFGLFTTINFHAWDLTRPAPEARSELYAQTSFLSGLSAPTGQPQPLPWRMCARTVGGVVSFKVWPTARPEPIAGDPCCTGRAALPPGIGPGRAGWYAGHVDPGGNLRYTSLTAGPLRSH